MRDWIIRNPHVVGVFFAAVVGWGAFNAYRAGIAVGEMRLFEDDAARLASEALGG